VLLARENGIGAATYQRKLDPAKQSEIRESLPMTFGVEKARTTNNGGAGRRAGAKSAGPSKRAKLRGVVEYIVQDPELQSRCADILLASANFDRPVNQATLVLEDRIRRKAEPPKKLVGENLVNYAFNEDINRAVLSVASNDPDDQRGFTQILRGVVPAFRNRTHHHLTNTFSREEALRVCGFIDVLLRVVDNCAKR
jgi:uncharacterized protein (TIGR02391 family)